MPPAMDINEYLTRTRDERTVELPLSIGGAHVLVTAAEPVVCTDGFRISVQASAFTYCTPRSNRGPWTHVECGFPSGDPGPAMLEFADNALAPSESVYPYVPVEIVQALIEQHGGPA